MRPYLRTEQVGFDLTTGEPIMDEVHVNMMSELATHLRGNNLDRAKQMIEEFDVEKEDVGIAVRRALILKLEATGDGGKYIPIKEVDFGVIENFAKTQGIEINWDKVLPGMLQEAVTLAVFDKFHSIHSGAETTDSSTDMIERVAQVGENKGIETTQEEMQKYFGDSLLEYIKSEVDCVKEDLVVQRFFVDGKLNRDFEEKIDDVIKAYKYVAEKHEIKVEFKRVINQGLKYLQEKFEENKEDEDPREFLLELSEHLRGVEA